MARLAVMARTAPQWPAWEAWARWRPGRMPIPAVMAAYRGITECPAWAPRAEAARQAPMLVTSRGTPAAVARGSGLAVAVAAAVAAVAVAAVVLGWSSPPLRPSPVVYPAAMAAMV